jgi:hypothetical protein
MWKNLPVVFLNGDFRHVCSAWLGFFNTEESLNLVDPGVFAGLLSPDGEVVGNSVQQ